MRRALYRSHCGRSPTSTVAPWLTIKKYESAGDYLPPASVGALDRLGSALENAGVQFDVEGAHLDRAATMKAQVAKDIDRGAAA